MRAKSGPDGVKRINAKVEIPMSHSDVSDYVLSAVVNGTSVDDVQMLNKRELLRVAKDQIFTYGAVTPRMLASEVNNDTDVIIRNYVKRMFPELV